MNDHESKRLVANSASRRRFLAGICVASATSLCPGLRQPAQAAESNAIAIFATAEILARARIFLGNYFTIVDGSTWNQGTPGLQVVAIIGVGAMAQPGLRAAQALPQIQRTVVIEYGNMDARYRTALASFVSKVSPLQPLLLLNGNYPTELAIWERTARFLRFAMRQGLIRPRSQAALPGQASFNVIGQTNPTGTVVKRPR